MYSVKLMHFDKDFKTDKELEIFACDTLEEANQCAQWYMANRQDFESFVYIMPEFEMDKYDEAKYLSCAKKSFNWLEYHLNLESDQSEWVEKIKAGLKANNILT